LTQSYLKYWVLTIYISHLVWHLFVNGNWFSIRRNVQGEMACKPSIKRRAVEHLRCFRPPFWLDFREMVRASTSRKERET
jgi:hypothetical protein